MPSIRLRRGAEVSVVTFSGLLYVSTDETSYEAGIKVQIHSQDEPPFIDQLGFGVAPGFQTFVSCQQQLVSNAQPLAQTPFPPFLPSSSRSAFCPCFYPNLQPFFLLLSLAIPSVSQSLEPNQLCLPFMHGITCSQGIS